MDFRPYDMKKDDLQGRYPHWRVWFVPCWDGHKPTVTWCSQPLPLLNCHSPEELEEEMRAADAVRAAKLQGEDVQLPWRHAKARPPSREAGPHAVRASTAARCLISSLQVTQHPDTSV